MQMFIRHFNATFQECELWKIVKQYDRRKFKA